MVHLFFSRVPEHGFHKRTVGRWERGFDCLESYLSRRSVGSFHHVSGEQAAQVVSPSQADSNSFDLHDFDDFFNFVYFLLIFHFCHSIIAALS
jgi:hypothetical protein